MNTPANFSGKIFSLLVAFFPFVGLAMYTLSSQESGTRWAIIGLLTGIVGLLFLFPPGSATRRRLILVMLLETAMAIGILILSRGDTPLAIVFSILSAQAINYFQHRAGFLWIAAFTLISGIIFIYFTDWNQGIIAVLLIGSSCFFFGAYALTAAQLDLAHRESQALYKQLAEAHRQLREQSVRDPLTGLFNRRYLEETLEREWARTRRHQLDLALAIIDIDHFKRVNDTYGHLAGDQVLRALGALVRENCRAEDVPCRYGGEEFVIILLETTLPNAHARAERWRALFEQLHTRWDNHTIHTTISIGLAISPAHADNPQQLIARADQALYRAKQAGRNRVIASNDETLKI